MAGSESDHHSSALLCPDLGSPTAVMVQRSVECPQVKAIHGFVVYSVTLSEPLNEQVGFSELFWDPSA